MHRSQNGFSQEKVAELVGVSRQAVTKWELNQSAPSTANLITLAEIFKITLDDLVSGVNQYESNEKKGGVVKLVSAIILAFFGVLAAVTINNLNPIEIVYIFGVDILEVNFYRMIMNTAAGMAIIAAIVLFLLYKRGLNR